MSNITTRPLTAEEVVILVMKSKQPWKSIYFLAVFTGLRISDLISLKWSADPQTTPIIEQKTKKPKTIIWTDLATNYWHELAAWENPRDFLLPFRDTSTYRKRIQADCKRLSIPGSSIAFHSLRKTHAVIAYRDGGILAAKNTMNHSSLVVTERYIETALKFETSNAFDRVFIQEK